MKNIISIVLVYLFLSPQVVSAADISYEEDGFKATVTIKGRIIKGDYDKFIEAALMSFAYATAGLDYYKEKKPDVYKKLMKKTDNAEGMIQLTVLLGSKGGDVNEAIKIGQAIRKMGLKTKVGDDKANAVCLSACFFIWMGGVEKEETFADINNLGVHRIYFNKDSYKDISSELAEKKYRKAKLETEAYLTEMGLSASLLNKIYTVPSNDIYFLDKSEVSALLGYVPYYDELLISRCGSYSKNERKDYLECNVMVPGMTDGFKDMKTSVKNSLIKRCGSLSSGYLTYLEEAVMGVDKCKNMNDAIETWKRMDSFFPHVNTNRNKSSL